MRVNASLICECRQHSCSSAAPRLSVVEEVRVEVASCKSCAARKVVLTTPPPVSVRHNQTKLGFYSHKHTRRKYAMNSATSKNLRVLVRAHARQHRLHERRRVYDTVMQKTARPSGGVAPTADPSCYYVARARSPNRSDGAHGHRRA